MNNVPTILKIWENNKRKKSVYLGMPHGDSIGSGISLEHDGNKPLPGPTLTYYQRRSVVFGDYTSKITAASTSTTRGPVCLFRKLQSNSNYATTSAPLQDINKLKRWLLQQLWRTVWDVSNHPSCVQHEEWLETSPNVHQQQFVGRIQFETGLLIIILQKQTMQFNVPVQVNHTTNKHTRGSKSI